jgi:GAF domain-containing protein
MTAKGKKQQEQDLVSLATLEKLLQVGQSLILVQDLEPLLQQIAESVGSGLGADVIVLYEYDEEANDVTVPPVIWGDIHHPEVPREKSQTRPHKESAVFTVLKRTEPFYASKAAEDWACLIEGWHTPNSFVHRESIISSAAVPLMTEKKRVGALFVNYRTLHTFPDEERKAIEIFATQVAIAIQNANLFAQMQQQTSAMDLLQQVSAQISATLNVEETLDLIIRGAMQLTGTESGVIHLVDEAHQTVTRSYEVPKGFGHLPPRLSEKKGMTWTAVSTGQTIAVSDIKKDKRVNPAMSTEKGVRAIIGTPLKVENQIIGVLFLNDAEPHDFTETEISLLSTLANQAAIAIRNARLFDDSQRRIRDLQIVRDVAEDIGTRFDTRDLLQTIVSKIADKLDCTHCTFFFPQEEQGELLLVPQVTRGVRSKQIMTRRFKPDEGLAGWVFQHGESLVLKNVMDDPRFAPARDKQGKPRSMLIAPVKAGDQTIGIISADQDRYGWFSENDRRLVDALARQAGIAIERAIGLELLRDIGNQIIGAPQVQVDKILQQIVSGAIRLTNTTAGIIFLLSEDGRAVTRQFEHPPGFNHPPPRLDGEGGITRQIFATGEVKSFPKIHQDPLVNPEMYNRVQSMIGVPLKLEEKVIGVLYLNDAEPHSFTETEISLLSTLTSQAAIAIQNARLFEESRQRTEELALLHNVGSQLMTLDLDELLSLIVQGAMGLTAADSGFIYLLNKDGTRILRFVALPPDFSSSFSPDGPPTRTSKNGLTRHIFEAAEPVFIPDTSQDDRVNPIITQSGIKSFFGQPLKVGDRVVGVLYLNRTSLGQFNPAQRSLISTLASQAAIAIDNARLFVDVQRQVKGHQTLNAVGTKLIGLLNEKDILKHVTRSAANTLDCTHCSVFRLQEDNLIVETSQGNRDWSFLEGRTFHIGQGIAGWVARKKKPILVPDVSKDKRFEAGWSKPQPDPQSLVVVPIFLEGEVYGVISAEHDQLGAFDDHDQRLLETLSSQTSQAIRNARLFDTQQRLNDQLESLHRVVQEQSLDRVLDRVAEGINAILGEEVSPTINLYRQDVNRFGECHACGPLQDELKVPPRAKGTARYVLETGKALYLEDVLNPPPGCPTIRQKSIDMGIKSFAAIPLKRQEQIVGVLFVNSQKRLSFSEEIRRVLEIFASQASIAIHISQDLERKIQELEVLTEIGRTVSTLGIDEILEQIHTQAAKLMDARNLYIAFYDEDTDTVSFPLAYSDGNGVETGVGAWAPRQRAEPLKEGQKRKPGEPRYGLTEYAIDHRKAEITRGNMQEWAKERGIELSPEIPTKSWIGAPLKVRDPERKADKIIGTISIQSHKEENAYDKDNLRILETMANQAAVAIENARLYVAQRATIRALEDAQDKIRQLERVRTMSNMAADFVHRINNMAGTIPIRVQRIREILSEKYPEARRALRRHLKGIMDDTNELLLASQRLQESTQEMPQPQPINVHELVATIVREIRLQTPDLVQVHDEHLATELPPVVGIEAELEEAIRDVTTNAVEAMVNTGGRFDISTAYKQDQVGKGWVEIEVKDEGYGIPEDVLSNIFDLFYTTKGSGLGYGLWRTKNTVESLGGEITVDSKVGKGTTVHIRLPAAKPSKE